MAAYLLRRLLGAIPLLLGIATILFLVLNLAPGDPTAYYVSPGVPPEVIEQMRRNFGLDEPVHVRYVRWLAALATGDFGYSFGQGRPVAAILLEALPNTLLLAGVALVCVFAIGILVGVFQSVRQHSWADRVLSVASLFFYSMPSFWLGLMLMLIFALKAYEWGWPIALPPTGMVSVDYEFLSPGQRLLDRIAHLVLPATTLTLVLGRRNRALYPRPDARGHTPGLHPHRAREGALRADGHR